MNALPVKHKRFKISLAKKRDPGVLALSPVRDWRILVLVFFTLVAGLFTLHYWIYAYFRGVAAVNEGKVPDSVETFDRDVLTRTVKTYRAKESEYARYLATPPEIIDPSL